MTGARSARRPCGTGHGLARPRGDRDPCKRPPSARPQRDLAALLARIRPRRGVWAARGARRFAASTCDRRCFRRALEAVDPVHRDAWLLRGSSASRRSTRVASDVNEFAPAVLLTRRWGPHRDPRHAEADSRRALPRGPRGPGGGSSWRGVVLRLRRGDGAGVCGQAGARRSVANDLCLSLSRRPCTAARPGPGPRGAERLPPRRYFATMVADGDLSRG